MAAKNKLANIMKTAVDAPYPTSPKMSSDEKARQMRYQAEDDLRAITRAAEIQRDRQRMSAVKMVAREQIKSLSTVTGGKKK